MSYSDELSVQHLFDFYEAYIKGCSWNIYQENLGSSNLILMPV